MVAAPVAVFHFKGIGSRSQGHELVPQADGKDRDVRFIQLSDFSDDAFTFFGVSGAVRKHDAVRPVRNDFLRACKRRIHGDVAASHGEGAGDVILGSQIQQGHPFAGSAQFFYQGGLLFFLPGKEVFLIKYGASGKRAVISQILHAPDFVFGLAGYLFHHLASGVFCQPRQDFFQAVICVGGYHAVHGSFFSQDFRQRSGVNACNSRHAVHFQVFLDRTVGAEITWHSGQFSYDKAVRPGSS